MKISVAFMTLLAGFAMASPAKVGDLEARVDCSTCGCSSAESCTVSSSPQTIVLDMSILNSFLQFDVSLYHHVFNYSDYLQMTDSRAGSSVAK